MPVHKLKFTKPSIICSCAVGGLLFPAAAHADAGIPMLPFAYPVILVFLLPVIAVEVVYIRLRLRTNWKNTIGATAKANLITLLLGFPLSWLVFLIAELVFYLALTFSGIEDHVHWTLGPRINEFLIVITSAAWMEPIEEKWAVPVAFVVLLIPSFFLSGYVESRLLDKRGWLRSEGRSSGVIWQANILSYIFLAVVGSVALVTVVAHL
ncbi:MAG: hypothetical protein ACLP07_17240 [Terracidiphilus sp.]